MTDPAAVIARAAEVTDAAAAAATWIDGHGAALKQDRATLIREFRRYGRRGGRLREAAQRPMCVAVFGASQAGKSYLVSRLAAAPGGRLAARFGDLTLDFLKDINPPGGQEATGLVTRFTTRPAPSPPGTPVTLRLLSQTDVVKILANTFYEDFDIEMSSVTPDAVALERLFSTLAASAQPGPADTLTGDDVEDLAEYFDRHFRNNPLLAQLNACNYWPRASDLAPRLSVAQRGALFAVLWGGTPRLTELYVMLVDALASLQHAPIVHCGLDALVPRETSIIDVRMLFGIGDGGTPDMIAAITPGGVRAALPRPVLTALVAELTVPLAERPWPFFDETDLLDFPGARTREAITDIHKFLAQPEKLGRALLRGKVAYLFQRYNAENEITSMLLCVGPSNQEVQTLPRMVQDWIDLGIGPTPQARAQQKNSLFLVLTKFDSEFEDKAGEDPASGQRWTARLQASLLDFFGKAYDWPHEWAPGRPFDNTYWLRNPSIGFGAVFDYGPAAAAGEQGPEIGVAPRAAAAVAVKRTAYLGNDLVRRHIADAAFAWDSALAPNDGGIGRLAGALAPVCDPSLKANQVAARVEELAGGMAERLRPLWRSDDRAAELEQARRRADEVLRALIGCARAQMFGPMLRAMQITPEQVAGVYWRLQTEPGQDVPVGVVSARDEYESLLFGEAEAPADPADKRLDHFERFAERVIGAWDEALQAFAADAAFLAQAKLSPEHAAYMAGQIAAAARRTDLRGRLAASVRERAGYHGRSDTNAGKFVRIAEDMVNGFVAGLGYDRIEEARRPAVGPAGPNQRRVFAARPPVTGLPPLAAQPTPYDQRFHLDWMAAFKRMAEDNVIDQTAEAFDVAANDALGALLRRLGGAKGMAR